MNSRILEDLLMQAPVLCFLIAEDERLVLLSGGLCRPLKLSAKDLLQSPAFRQQSLPIRRNHFLKALKGHEFTITLSILGATYETHLKPFALESGTQAVLGFSIDMTKHMQLEQQLDDERHRLLAQQRLNSLAGIANGLAHEINNPLAIISGYAQQLNSLVLSGGLSQDRLHFTTKKIIEASQRCHTIIESLRHFARDGSHDPVEKCFANDIVKVALQLCEQSIQALGVRLEWTPLKEDLCLEGRRIQLVQVLFNVITNAYQAALLSKEPRIRIQILDHHSKVSIEVHDNGPGIPESHRVKIFEPFFTTKEQAKSVGVGLSTAKGMIEEHGGKISFISNPGATCFSIALPKSSALPQKAVS